MDDKYNQNYTVEEIQDVIAEIAYCVNKNKIQLLLGETRQKNVEFMQQYQLNTSDLKSILLRLKYEDFCGTLESENENHINDILYVFVPQEKLHDIHGKLVQVSVYIKLIFQGKPSDQNTIIISFHELEYPITYAFK